MYIIDEAHMLTGAAFNALLKTLEEPPPGTVFLLASNSLDRLLPTIRSEILDYSRAKLRADVIAALTVIKPVARGTLPILSNVLLVANEKSVTLTATNAEVADNMSSLGASVRETDTVARFGGDEFVVMLEDLSEDAFEAATQAKTVGEKIQHRLNQIYQLGPCEHHSTPSIGVTLYPQDGSDADVLLRQGYGIAHPFATASHLAGNLLGRLWSGA